MSIYPGGYTPSVGMSIYPGGYMPSVGMSIYPGGYMPSVGMSIYPGGYMPSVGMSIYLGGHTPSVEASQITTDFYDETDTAPVSITEFGEITVVDRLAGIVEMLITRGDKKSTW